MNPVISVITVARNAEETIPATLRSLREQTCPPEYFEFVVIDGASDDATVSLVRDAGIPNTTIVSEPDNGLYDAMNKGIGLAAGTYMMFLNAGDAFHSPLTLQQIVETAKANDYPGIIYGQTQIVDADRHRIADRHLTAPERLTLQSFSRGMLVCHQAFIAHRNILSTYDLRYRFSADYEWCIRCLQHSRHNVLIPGIMIDYLSEGLTTRNHRRSLCERFRIMCRYYGTIPTIFRHIGFFFRNLRRKFQQ